MMSRVHWPEYMLVEILLWLPVKSMVRFRCIAKTWNSLFRNPWFVSQHLNISKRRNKRLLVLMDNNNSLCRLFLDQTLVSYQDFQPLEPRDILIFQTRRFCVHDGIFCVYDSATNSITLCNPASKEFRLLPPCFPGKLFPGQFPKLGFGRDSSSNDYKVICIYTNQYWKQQSEYAVYTMSSNSWRVLKVESVEVEALRDIYTNNCDGSTCVDGVYYWVAFKQLDDYSKVILAFHFGNENFELIDWPAEASHYYGKLNSLPHDENRISLWTFGRNGFNGDDWVINEAWMLNDDRRSWSKVLEIGPLFQMKILGFWNGLNKVIVKSLETGKLSLYDLDTKEVISSDLCTERNFFGVFIYEESCVSVKLL